MKTSEIPINERLQIYERALEFMKTQDCAGLCHAVALVIIEIDPTIGPAKTISEVIKHPMGKYVMSVYTENYPELVVQHPTFITNGYTHDMSFWWPEYKKGPRVLALELAIEMCKRGMGYDENEVRP